MTQVLVKRGISYDGHSYQVDVPDACPICHRHSEMQFSVGGVVDQERGVQAVFRCAYRHCRVFFICSYGPRPSAELLGVRPLKSPESLFSEAIAKLSPMFISIFGQAAEAKHLQLAQIAGPGFRKAFEFLVKDYAKSLQPSKSDEIEKSFSGKVVADYIPDARVQAVAKRCLWLGNDETHYLRKWMDRDIEDFVNLIKLTTHWIEMEELSKTYVQEMPE